MPNKQKKESEKQESEVNENPLYFRRVEQEDEVKKVYNYNIEAFSPTADFEWSLKNIKYEMEDGWEMHSVSIKKEIIAAIFTKIEDNALHTKSTPIKMEYRGNGHSHRIKEFYEDLAQKSEVNVVVSYCRSDNFRMISLNETHGYIKDDGTFGPNGEYLMWRKKL